MKKSIGAEEIESLDVADSGLVRKGLRVSHTLFGEGTVVALFAFPNGSHFRGVEFATVGHNEDLDTQESVLVTALGCPTMLLL